MKRHILTAGTVILALGLSLTGCSLSKSSEDTVAVQSVSMLAGLGTVGIQNRYAGVVVAQATHSISKDSERTVAKLNVAVGDQVKAGEILFSYDTDEIKLSIESAELEVEKLQNTIETTNKQIEELEKEKKKAKSSEQLEYTINIQTMQADVKEDEYNIKTKQAEVDRLKKTLDNSEVRSEVSGTVQSIKESSSDGSDSDDVSYSDDGGDAYITIVEDGTFRVKGTVNEMNVSDIGSMEGSPVIIRSRVDDSQTWAGTMGAVDTEKTVSDNSSSYYDGDSGDDETSSSKYPFYVELDESEGLMLGQHVYIELDEGQEDEQTGLNISSVYIAQEDDGSAYVWAATDKDELEKREIILGEYNEEMDTYEVTGGLTAEDYIAIPDESLKEGMAVARYDESYYDQGDDSEDGGYEDGVSDEEGLDSEDGLTDEGGMYSGDGLVSDQGLYSDGGFEDEGDYSEDFPDDEAAYEEEIDIADESEAQ